MRVLAAQRPPAVIARYPLSVAVVRAAAIHAPQRTFGKLSWYGPAGFAGSLQRCSRYQELSCVQLVGNFSVYHRRTRPHRTGALAEYSEEKEKSLCGDNKEPQQRSLEGMSLMTTVIRPTSQAIRAGPPCSPSLSSRGSSIPVGTPQEPAPQSPHPWD